MGNSSNQISSRNPPPDPPGYQEIQPSDCFKAVYYSPADSTIYECQRENQPSIIDGPDPREMVSPPTLGTHEGVQGQICVKYWKVPPPDIKKKNFSVGSGTVCVFGTSFESPYFLLSCAHTFYYIDQKKKIMKFFEDGKYFYIRNGKEEIKMTGKISPKHVRIYPGYENHEEIYEGYDLAIAKLQGDFHKTDVSQNSYWSNIDDENAKPGDSILVIGYPGEKQGLLYKMEGKIKEIKETKNGRKLILYDTITTTGGQSGSPVYFKKSNGMWGIIGIHVGYDNRNGANVNVATAITRELWDWIKKEGSSLVNE